MFVNTTELCLSDKNYYDKLSLVQKEVLEYCLPHKNVLNVSSTGVGKTKMAVDYINAAKPKNVLIATTVKTIDQWAEYLPGAIVYKSGKQPELSVDRQLENGVHICGLEYLTSRLKRSKLVCHIDMLVIDESHRASATSVSLRQLKRIKTDKKMFLSATAEYNKPENLFYVASYLFGKNNVSSWDDFVKEYCTTQQFVRYATRYDRKQCCFTTSNGIAMAKANKITGWRADARERFLVALPCVVSVGNIALPYHDTIFNCHLSSRQRVIYDNLKKHSVAETRGGVIKTDMTVTQRIRLKQCCLAEPVVVGQELPSMGDVEFLLDSKSTKIKAIHQILLNHDTERVLIGTSSLRFAKLLERRFSRVVSFDGTLSASKRTDIIRWFLGTKDAVLVGVYGALSEGLDGLQKVCNIEIIADESEPIGGAQQKQFAGRLNRTGSSFDYIERYLLVSPDTIESELYEQKNPRR